MVYLMLIVIDIMISITWRVMSRWTLARKKPRQTASEAVVARSVESGGCPLSELDCRKAISPAEREGARKKLARIPADVAQQLLDERAAGIGANVIGTTPLAYLRGLIARAAEGRFTPEGALQVADRRNRRAAVDAALCGNETGKRGNTCLVVDADEPLIRRLLDMQGKLQEKDPGLDRLCDSRRQSVRAPCFNSDRTANVMLRTPLSRHLYGNI
jgi:hypothetical protein